MVQRKLHRRTGAILIMSDNREVARQLLLEAGEAILKNRPGVHGSAENSFQMIADMWSVYIEHMIFLRHGIKVRIALSAVDTSHMMSQLKQVRSVYGDPMNRDNYVDEIGYAALAGMLALPADIGDHLEETRQMKALEDEVAGALKDNA